MIPDDQPDDDRWVRRAAFPTEIEQEMERAASVLAEFPAGNVLAGLIRGEVARRRNRRLYGFLKRLRDGLRAVEDQINEQFWGSDEWENLAEEVFSRAAETRQEEKLEAYRNIFVNAVTRKDASYDEAARVIRLLRRWDPEHIIMLRLLTDPEPFFEDAGAVKDPLRDRNRNFRFQLEKLTGWHRNTVERVWRDLERDFIHEMNTDIDGMSPMSMGKFLEYVTGFGQEVAEYLSSPID